MKRVAYMFPGQGSQGVGMAKDFYEEYEGVRRLFEKANNLLNKDITSLIFEGPGETLTETENTQPALLLVSTAVNQLLEKEGYTTVAAIGQKFIVYIKLQLAG